MATTITANGINFPDGSAGTPSIGGSDTNTGLFTGSDIIGFATGGSERLKIDASGNVNIANDSGKLRLGASNDLQIYHNGSHSYIVDSGTGNLILQTSKLNINNAAGTEALIHATENGKVELYYDNSVKLETSSSGATITGSLTTGGFTSTTAGDALFTGTTSGRNAKWDTSHNRLIFDDNALAVFGSGADLQIFHDGSDSRITNTTGALQITGNNDFRLKTNGGQNIFKATGNAVELYYDTGSGGSSKKFETTGDGAKLTSGSHFDFHDNSRIRLGDGADLQIFHNGSQSKILDSTGNELRINANTIRFRSSADDETYANFIDDGAVELYHNGSKKFETTSGGIEVSGGANFTSGNISLLDNSKIKLGNADDLQIYHDGSDSFIKDAGTGGLYIHTNQFLVRNAAGSQPNMEIQDNGQVFVPEVYNRTTGSSVNMRVDSDGELRRSTSSKRYKKDITDATWGLAELLKLRPITYKSNATGKDADDKTYGGFIAEDVHDLGLTEFVDYNEKNEPDALAYGNMVALMAKAIQDLNAKVEALEAA